MLARIIAALHDENGRVTVPGFYDGVKELPADIKAELKALNLTAEQFLGQVGLKVAAGEKDRMLIEQISTRPTCDVNGIVGGYTGEGAKTVIAAQATRRSRSASSASRTRRRSAKRSAPSCARGFRPTPGRSSSTTPAARRSRSLMKIRRSARRAAALTEEWGTKSVAVGSGGSIPIVGDFKNVLGMDTLLVGFGLDDDRVHSPNEKYDLTSFHKGTRSWARILAALAG